MTRKGVVHTLDAFLAAIIVTTSLLYVSQIPLEREYTETSDFDALGMQVLVCLDSNGSLGRLIDREDWDGIENSLRIVLPSRTPFNLTIYDEHGGIVNTKAISNGGIHGRMIYSVDYLLVIKSGEFSIYRLRLQLGG
ncbi:MAG: hypothetical protein PVJ38_06285 [Candidatus Bathyarchaeota archaeon]|jgi:hypothetical protein